VDNRTQININLPNVLEVALLGVRRAAMFIGLGVNAAENPAVIDYKIHGFKEINLLPDDLPNHIIEASKRDFRQWIIGNGLTELLHQYSLFLDELYVVGLFVRNVRKSDDIILLRPRISAFRSRTSIASKLRSIHNELGLESQFRVHFHGFVNARNALIHANGRVLSEHCNNEAKDRLDIAWPGFDVIVRDPTGEETECRPDVIVQAGSELLLHILIRQRTFAIGEIIQFSPTDINEICYMVTRDARELVDGLTQTARTMGIRELPNLN
jgi:hypothetical protein